MLKIAVFIGAVALGSAKLWSAPQPVTPAPADLLGRIMEFRLGALSDRVLLDVCKIDMFWNSDGTPIAVPDLLPPKHKNRADCALPKTLPRAEISEIVVTSDSIVVYGGTRHGGIGRAEIYVFLNKRPHAIFKEYRIVRLTTYN